MTLEELRAVAEIVEKLTNRYRDQDAAHKTALAETRASFNARTGADEKTIEGLRVQVQDMREEIIRVNEAHGKTKVERDGLLDELAVQRDAFTAEVERIRRELHEGRDAEATVKLTPKVGDTVRLVTHPERARVAEHLRTALKWPWIDRWGVVGQTGKVVKPLVAVAGAVAVALDGSTIFARWPIDCLEVVAEATHDTDAGKAVALETEPVGEEIKVGDMVEVFQKTGSCTFETDIGTRGTVLQMEDSCVDTAPLDGYLSPKGNHVALCDVRKVTT